MRPGLGSRLLLPVLLCACVVKTASALKKCPLNCSGVGNCDEVQGVCECPFAFSGDGCEVNALQQCPGGFFPLEHVRHITNLLWNGRTLENAKYYSLGPWPCACLAASFKVLNMRFGLRFLCVDQPLADVLDDIEAGSIPADEYKFVTLGKPDVLVDSETVQKVVPEAKLPALAALSACGGDVCEGWCSEAKDGSPVCRCWDEAAIFSHGKCQQPKNGRSPALRTGCLDACSAAGTCVRGNFCHCKPGHWGPDCGLTARGGEAALTRYPPETLMQRGTEDIKMRFYVYALPKQYMLHYTPTHHYMATHVVKSAFRTPDPGAAAAFFLVNGDDVMQARRGIALLRWMRDAAGPWYNASKSAGHVNHILMLTKDYGWGSSWWRPNALLKSKTYEPEFNPCHPDRAIMSLQFADYQDGAAAGDKECKVCYQRGKDIQIPALESAADGPCHIIYNRSKLRGRSPWSTSANASLATHRKWHMFFGGHSVEYPEDQDTPGRWTLLKYHANRTDWLVLSTGGDHKVQVSLPSAMTSSRFCYVPLGRTDPGYTGRFIHAVLFGCIPAFWTPTRERARVFEELPGMAWRDASVTVRRADVPTLHETLARYSEDALERMRSHLAKMWEPLLWSSLFGPYLQEDGSRDAWHSVLRIFQLRQEKHAAQRRAAS